MSDRTYRIATIPGDGVGIEVTAEAVKALDAAAARFGFTVTYTDYDLGGGRYLQTGEVLPDSVQDELADHDAILLGAVGTPDVPPGVLERGLLLKLRFDFDQYVNLRPVKLYPGVPSPIAGLTPERCDMVVVRENTEGLYAGAGGLLYRRAPPTRSPPRSRSTPARRRAGVRYAFERASATAGQAHAVPQDQRADLRRRPVVAHRSGGRRGRVPRRGDSTTSTSTRLPLPGHSHRSASTSWSPTTCSATSSPTSAPPCRAGSGWPLPATSTRPGSAIRRCSSRCTARLPTSPARLGEPGGGGALGGDVPRPPGARPTAAAAVEAAAAIKPGACDRGRRLGRQLRHPPPRRT
jgi:hypothetical protein